ncbi:hypothetical protein GCK72_009719 [Caenorhabditis remanei]|uniref:Uncharacterized protein n=1 Tax=Caenorhabditis remanei TaxID=31234 RepID=A0A6A5H4M5_CAERE|nr:hypothetical protein GCK72_009719 [Caenorhabditis remanei]KAF1761463.1 hypothetical protein GCK72_009719 [Caenorhabditis remanei]
MHEKEDDGEEDNDHLLEEDKYGRLICRKTRTVYPHGEKLTRENVEEAFNEESPAISLSSEVFSDREITVNSNSPLTPNPKLFIGGATETEAENMIGFCGFVVYYRMPEDGTMQFSLPLMLAYRSSQGDHFHFPISQSKHYDSYRKLNRSMFRVECDDVSIHSSDHGRLVPGFFSLAALIKHYKTFAYHDTENGILETFPISLINKKRK